MIVLDPNWKRVLEFHLAEVNSCKEKEGNSFGNGQSYGTTDGPINHYIAVERYLTTVVLVLEQY